MPSFDLQPTLKGKLLYLRPMTTEDFDPLFAIASDPLIWEQHPERNRYERDVFMGFFKTAMDSKGALVAVDVKTNEILGSSRFTGLIENEKRIEVGYTFLARKCWGRNYNREMKRLMLDHAFQYVDRVVFYIGENNIRSRKAVEKIGAHFMEKIERPPREGVDHNAIVYGIEKSDWHRLRNGDHFNLNLFIEAKALYGHIIKDPADLNKK